LLRRFLAVDGGRDLAALARQAAFEGTANVRVVFDDQDAALCRTVGGRGHFAIQRTANPKGVQAARASVSDARDARQRLAKVSVRDGGTSVTSRSVSVFMTPEGSPLASPAPAAILLPSAVVTSRRTL